MIRRPPTFESVVVGLLAWIAVVGTFTAIHVAGSDAPQGAGVGVRSNAAIQSGEIGRIPLPPAVRSTSVPDLMADVAVEESGSDSRATTATPPTEPGYWGASLSTRQVEGLALYVSDDPRFVAEIVPVLACESALGRGAGARYYVGALHRNDDGSWDRGLAQANDVHAASTDLDRMERDPIYAMQWTYRQWQERGLAPWESSASCWGHRDG